jgi:hypothetical protein
MLKIFAHKAINNNENIQKVQCKMDENQRKREQRGKWLKEMDKKNYMRRSTRLTRGHV